eukprot:9890879-Alexandrium_andersonii.AAC.1
MSASLVGSEMCIRDSTPFPRHGVLPPPPDHPLPGASRVREAPLGREAVSYTHLTLPTICSV